MRYSPSTKGFYPEDMDYPNLPTDLIQIPEEKFQELQAGLSVGKVIVLQNGIPELVDPVDLMNLSEIKTYAISTLPQSIISEITLANNLIFDDSEKSLNYLQTKRATSNAIEKVYDKYNNSETMTNAQLTTAVSTLATSIMQKDDVVKAKVVEISNASSIDEVKDLAGIYQEKSVKLIVDVDGANFDSTNQVTSESLNQVVMADGGVDLSAISWINAIGVKSINGQTKFVEVVDSNNINTAQIGLSQESPIINGIIKANGLPVELEMVVYCKNLVTSQHMTRA